MEHLISKFNEYLLADLPGEQFRVIHNGKEKDFGWLVEQLRNCHVQIPRMYCESAMLPDGCTYSQAISIFEEGARRIVEEGMKKLKHKYGVDSKGYIHRRKPTKRNPKR